MNLPEDKSERAKVLVLIAIGAAAVVYAIVQLGIMPMIKAQKQGAARIIELQEALGLADLDIEQMKRDKERNKQTVQQIVDISEAHFLRPSLGANYSLSATGIIEKHAQLAGIQLDFVREVGISEIPNPPLQTTERTLKAYTTRVTMQCGFHALSKFLEGLESDNPYLCVVGLNIAGQPAKDPENHVIVLEVQWPVWADQNTPDELAEQLKEEDDKSKNS